jgi:Tfp pilus assembly protein PilF
MGDVVRAQEQLQQALVLNPDWVPGMVNLADLYRAQGRDAEAGPLLQQALLRVPDSADVLVARAMWLVRQGQREAAVGLLARAFAQQPTQRTAYLYAVALHSIGDSPMALQVIEDVMASGRRFEQVLNLGLSIAEEIGDFERLARYRRGVASSL